MRLRLCSLRLRLCLPGARRAGLPRGAATADEPRGELVQGAKGARVRYTPLPCYIPLPHYSPLPCYYTHLPRCTPLTHAAPPHQVRGALPGELMLPVITPGTWRTASPAGGSTTGSAARASILRDHVSTQAMSLPGESSRSQSVSQSVSHYHTPCRITWPTLTQYSN